MAVNNGKKSCARPIGETPDQFTLTLPSPSPRILIYAIGGNSPYDNKVPNTKSGFVIPEIPLGTIFGMASMLGSAVLMKLRKR
jgi:hypothetical protein